MLPRSRFGLVSNLAVRGIGLKLAGDEAVVALSAEWLLNGKAIGLEAQTLNTLLERQADSALLRQLNDLRAQEAVLALRVVKPEQRDALRQQRDGLQTQRRDLEKQIAQADGAAAKLEQSWIELATVRRAIPQDGWRGRGKTNVA